MKVEIMETERGTQTRRGIGPNRSRRWRRVATAAAVAMVASVAVVPMAVAQDTPSADQDAQMHPALLIETPLGPDGEAPMAAAFPNWQRAFDLLGPDDEPRGIHVDPETGVIAVTEIEDDRISRFRPDGVAVATRVTDDHPTGIYYANGDMYVVARDASTVTVYDAQTLGEKRSWGTLGSGNGQFDRPCDVVVSDVGEVFVADADNDRIQVFDVNGGYLRQFGSLGSGNGEFNISCTGAALAIGGGELFVADNNNARVQVVDLDGNYLRQWGSSGSANGQFDGLHGLDYNNGHVYTAEWSGERVQVFTAGGIFQGKLDVPGYRTEDVSVDPSGTVMRISTGEGPIVTFTTLTCGGNVPEFVGGSYDEDFAGTGFDDTFHMGAGDDVFSGSSGEEYICGGDGDDDIEADAGRDFIWGGEGNDVLDGGDDRDRIWAGDGDDIVYGGGGSDRMRGGPGEDTLNGGSGADAMYGDTEDDMLFGQGGQDRMYGGDGNDLLQGNHNSDTLWGGSGDDTIRGAKGKDKLYGESGNDMLYGGDNSDVLRGGLDNDHMDGQKGSDTCPDGNGVNTRVSC